MEDHRREPEALSDWLRERGVSSGDARKQPAIGVADVWGTAVRELGDARVTAAFDRVLAAQGNVGLDRPGLFAFAANEDWEALHLGALVWGYGRFSNLTHDQSLLSFQRTEPEVREAVCEAARSDTESAWNLWWVKERQTALPGLRVAMGTKLLYFAGYEMADAPLPLIFDRRVHSALGQLGYDFTSPEGNPRTVTWVGEYRPYLQLCADAATSVGVEADDVEYALFESG